MRADECRAGQRQGRPRRSVVIGAEPLGAGLAAVSVVKRSLASPTWRTFARPFPAAPFRVSAPPHRRPCALPPASTVAPRLGRGGSGSHRSRQVRARPPSGDGTKRYGGGCNRDPAERMYLYGLGSGEIRGFFLASEQIARTLLESSGSFWE